MNPVFTEAIAEINQIIELCGEDSNHFAETLRERRIPHLSFSQVSTVEFCPRRYYLEYVKFIEIEPVPLYFTKGKVLHDLIAAHSRKKATGETLHREAYLGWVERSLDEHALSGEHRAHLSNALSVYIENQRPTARVIAVEKPFVMVVDPELPPCVGVIDLVLEQDGSFLLVDHKTGRDFYPDDELQAAIYSEFMRRHFEGDCAFYYEHYRWVNHLERLRKPAFQRSQVCLPAGYWQPALKRIQNAYRQMREIQNGQHALRTGDCFRCPYRSICREW